MTLDSRQQDVARRLAQVSYSDRFWDRKISALIPVAACAWYGCPHRPRWFLGRFATRPWRCERCRTWWITVPDSGFERFVWRWEAVNDEAPTDESVWKEASG